MSATTSLEKGESDLESVIVTEQLNRRATRCPDQGIEIAALLKLQRELAQTPESFFQTLVDAVLELSNADSSGISLLNAQKTSFIWPAVAGPLNRFLWQGTPSGFGPCGTVLERNNTLLMAHPERHFAYLTQVTPALEEVLLIPFYMEKQAVGTIWAVIHTPEKKFDAEDKRLLESLSAFAASAYVTLFQSGRLQPILKREPGDAK